MLEFTRYKFCPRCAGTGLTVFLKNGMRCTSCGYIYFHNMCAAVAAIVEVGEKIVLIRRAHEPKKGLFDLPGGFVDYGESLETALAREVREELNIDITDIRYFGSFPNEYQYEDVVYFTADAFFLCRPLSTGRMAISEENSEILSVRPGEIDDRQIAFPSMVSILGQYRRTLQLQSADSVS